MNHFRINHFVDFNFDFGKIWKVILDVTNRKLIISDEIELLLCRHLFHFLKYKNKLKKKKSETYFLKGIKCVFNFIHVLFEFYNFLVDQVLLFLS